MNRFSALVIINIVEIILPQGAGNFSLSCKI